MSTKITVIGAGSVGSAITNDIMVQGIASEVVLIDINKQKAMGEALAVGDKIEIGLYPADVELPKDTRRLRYSVESAETEGCVKLMAVVFRRGMTITVR